MTGHSIAMVCNGTRRWKFFDPKGLAETAANTNSLSLRSSSRWPRRREFRAKHLSLDLMCCILLRFVVLHFDLSFWVNISMGYRRIPEPNRRSSTVNGCSNWAYNRTYSSNLNSHDRDEFQSFQETLHLSPLQDPAAQASQKPTLPTYQVVHCLNLSGSKHTPHCAHDS